MVRQDSLPNIIIVPPEHFTETECKMRYVIKYINGIELKFYPFGMDTGWMLPAAYDEKTETVYLMTDHPGIIDDAMQKGLIALYVQFLLTMPKACW
jgi:hypothetical protein